MKASDSIHFRILFIVINCFICAMLTVLSGCGSDGNSTGGDVEASSDDQPLPYSYPDWMSSVPDSKYLSEITIPGTHDSAADLHTSQQGPAPTSTVISQHFRMSNQLLLGVRWFDIRLYLNGSSLTAAHGDYYLHKNFDDELGYALDFLRDHPTETVIFMIKQEHSTLASDQDFGNAVYSYLENRGLNNFYLTNAVPQLKNVRGKIVIIRRFHNETSHDNFGMYFYWDDNTKGASFSGNGVNIYVEDHWSLYSVPYSQKIQETEDSITKSRNETDRKKFYLSYASGEKDTKSSLLTVAHNTNPEIRDWLRNSYTMRSGVILVNFAGGADTDSKNPDRTSGPEIVKYALLMNSGQPLWATGTGGYSGAYYKMQADGNFVIYSKDGAALWSTGTEGYPGAYYKMQEDGNFVIYSKDGSKTLWSTNTAGNPGAFWVMQDDGNFVIYRATE